MTEGNKIRKTKERKVRMRRRDVQLEDEIGVFGSVEGFVHFHDMRMMQFSL